MPDSLLTRRTGDPDHAAGLLYSINYDLHVQHLTAELAKATGPELKKALARVNKKVYAGKASRIQALSTEIGRWN